MYNTIKELKEQIEKTNIEIDTLSNIIDNIEMKYNDIIEEYKNIKEEIEELENFKKLIWQLKHDSMYHEETLEEIIKSIR